MYKDAFYVHFSTVNYTVQIMLVSCFAILLVIATTTSVLKVIKTLAYQFNRKFRRANKLNKIDNEWATTLFDLRLKMKGSWFNMHSVSQGKIMSN